ncbi:MAG: uridine kinase [Deltaproteobacteria bacterium]|nr:MAG: uridine kinase [Deltaproteobacteria bacterium]
MGTKKKEASSTRKRAFVIGIAGGTGSGKTTLTKNIVSLLPEGQVSVLRADWYYNDQSDMPYEQRLLQNYDHPDAIEFPLLVRHVKALSRGRAVSTPRYNFVTHTRMKETVRVEPAPVVIVEGILIFTHEPLLSQFDLKIYVEASADLRLLRRLQRDITERGRSLESCIDQYLTTVRPMHETFVEPSRLVADIIVPALQPNPKAIDMIVDMIMRRLGAQGVS